MFNIYILVELKSHEHFKKKSHLNSPSRRHFILILVSRLKTSPGVIFLKNGPFLKGFFCIFRTFRYRYFWWAPGKYSECSISWVFSERRKKQHLFKPFLRRKIHRIFSENFLEGRLFGQKVHWGLFFRFQSVFLWKLVSKIAHPQ